MAIMENKKKWIWIFLFSFALVVFSSSTPVPVEIVTQAPLIDGSLDDTVWQNAAVYTDFKTYQPDYRKVLSQKTIAYITYDEDNFYFAFRCFDTEPGKILATLSKRDTLNGDDWVGLVLDTFNDQQSGFCFILNPIGVQTDGMINLQGNLDSSLDMVWYSKGKVDNQGYTVEGKIPLKSIRFPGKKNIDMGIMFFRTIVRTSEQASYPGIVPEGGGMLTQSHKIKVSGLKYQRVVEVLPAYTFYSSKAVKSGILKSNPTESDLSLTAKLGLTSTLTLDGTYNPDFSQVEADAGQIDVNLRYNLYYPEKRPFFLEGNENFQFAGNTEDAPLISMVHTRTIVDPSLGLKLSGRLGKKTNLTALFAIDDSPGFEKDSQGNYLNEDQKAYFSVMRFRHPLKDDSYIGGFYTGRELGDGFNRVVGTDGHFRLSKYAEMGFHAFGSYSRKSEGGDANFGHALAASYAYGSRNLITEVGIQDLSRNFQVDTGFIERSNLTRLAGFLMYRFYPKSKFFQRIEPFYWGFQLYDKESRLMETCNLFTLRFWLPGQTQFRIDLLGANEAFAAQRFDCSAIRFQTYSQFTKQFYFEFYYRYGGKIFYDPQNPYQSKGNSGSLAFLYQPTDKLTSILSLSYTDLYRSVDDKKIYDYLILRNRTTFQINKYLYFRGIGEYNTYRKRMTLDFLASFTYIPGTVVYLGYGSIFEKTAWQNDEYIDSNRFMEMKRGLFFKVSYLWRM